MIIHKSHIHLTPSIVIRLLLTIFPMLYFTSPWLFFNNQWVFLDLFTFFTHPSNPSPIWQWSKHYLYLRFCFCSACLFLYVCIFWFYIQVKSYGVCLPLSDLFYSAQSPPRSIYVVGNRKISSFKVIVDGYVIIATLVFIFLYIFFFFLKKTP